MMIQNKINIYKFIYKSIIVIILIIILLFSLKYIYIKISVIIPTFNRAHLILNSINSVLNQTLKNLEVIIVDDGSTDNTKKIIESIDDKRIKYIKLLNRTGGSNARNVGIKNAKGNYIAFQDSDDIYYPEKLEKQLKNIMNNNSDLDFCKHKFIRKNLFSYLLPNKEQEKTIYSGKLFEELISKGNFIPTPSVLIKKQIMKEYNFDSNL